MLKILTKFCYLMFIILICFLILNRFYIINFSDNVKNLIMFLSFLCIIITSTRSFFVDSGALKYINLTILIFSIIGGSVVVFKEQLNILIYLCALIALGQSLFCLTYAKA